MNTVQYFPQIMWTTYRLYAAQQLLRLPYATFCRKMLHNTNWTLEINESIFIIQKFDYAKNTEIQFVRYNVLLWCTSMLARIVVSRNCTFVFQIFRYTQTDSWHQLYERPDCSNSTSLLHSSFGLLPQYVTIFHFETLQVINRTDLCNAVQFSPV